MTGSLRLPSMLMALTLSTFACKKSSNDDRSGGGEAKTEATTAPGTLAILTGEILPADGAELSTVSGALVQAEGRPDIAAVTGADGKFAIENVVPGTVAIYIASNDGSMALTEAQAIGPSVYGLKISDVVLKSGEVADLGQQALKKTGGLRGKVLFYSNPNNLDLTGSEVFVPGTSFIAKTDASGAFALNGLPPGKYNMRVQHTGFAVLDIVDVEVLEDETVDIGNLTLSLSTGPEGSIAVVEDLTDSIAGNSSAKIVKSRLVRFRPEISLTADFWTEPSYRNEFIG